MYIFEPGSKSVICSMCVNCAAKVVMYIYIYIAIGVWRGVAW